MEWYTSLFEDIEAAADEQQAIKMAAYMKDQFSFLGLPKPILKKIMTPHLSVMRKKPIDWRFIDVCWEKDYREAQYVGMEYLQKHKEQLEVEDLPKLKRLVVTKSWWEVTDSIDALVGLLALKDGSVKKEMLQWSMDENMWVRRLSIDFQQRYEENTDVNILAQVIINNLGSKEFFINKAIGWSLQEYGKVNPKWVAAFVKQHESMLAPLSKKEALKNN